jgi:hypothetical protein
LRRRLWAREDPRLALLIKEASAGGAPFALAVKSQEIVQPARLGEGGCRQTTITAKEAPRMDIHKNARTTPHSRALIAARVAGGEPRALD